MSLEAIGKALDRAGMDRFINRAAICQQQQEGNDVDSLLYEGIMEALGYSRNREPFRELAQNAQLAALVGQPPEEIQAALFGVAGLLPSQRDKKTEFDAELKAPATDKYTPGSSVMMVVHPEKIETVESSDGKGNTLKGRITNIVYLGEVTKYYVEIENGQIIYVKYHNRAGISSHNLHDDVRIAWAVDDCKLTK